MSSLEKVAINDITKFKSNNQSGEEISTIDLKKKLIETVETNQLLQMLETTNKKDKSPVEVLNEVGFNIKDVTSGMKENIEAYKGLAEIESKKRSEIEERAEKAREQTFELREQLIETRLTQLVENNNRFIADLVKEIKENKGDSKKDPVSDVGSQIVLNLLNDKVEDLKALKNSNPLESIFASVDIYEKLKSLFKQEKTEIPDDPRRLDLEILKLKMEDERERIKEEKRIELDRDKHETVKYAINTIGAEIADAIGAFATVLSQNKQTGINQQPQTQTQNGQEQGIQGIPYQCESCGEMFFLQRIVENARCPYCGDAGEPPENIQGYNENVG